MALGLRGTPASYEWGARRRGDGVPPERIDEARSADDGIELTVDRGRQRFGPPGDLLEVSAS
jgi:hypothetical protein